MEQYNCDIIKLVQMVICIVLNIVAKANYLTFLEKKIKIKKRNKKKYEEKVSNNISKFLSTASMSSFDHIFMTFKWKWGRSVVSDSLRPHEL